MRSVSLAVDITNYTMFDLGQPMHAYDLGALAVPVVAHRARAGETLATPDGEKRKLDPQDLLITDLPERGDPCIIGVAGIMGGVYSEVSEGMTDVLFKAAHFDSMLVACSSYWRKLHSETAKRSGCGTDPQPPMVTAQRAVRPLLEYGGGTADAGATNVDQRSEAVVILLPVGGAERLTGAAHAPERTVELLRIVGCVAEGPGNDAFTVTAFSWCSNLTPPVDLAEEVARPDGCDSTPVVMPIAPAGHGLAVARKAYRPVAATLADGGLAEVGFYPLVPDTWGRQGISADDPCRKVAHLRNPMADNAPWLHTMMFDTLLDVVDCNASRSNTDVAIFEVVRVTRPAGIAPADLPSAKERPSDEVVVALEAGTLA